MKQEDFENNEKAFLEVGRYRAVWIDFQHIPPCDWYKLAWGADIWIQGFPILKIFLLANLVVWALMLWTR